METTWNCPMCTFENHPAINSCEICGTARLTTSQSAPSSSSFPRHAVREEKGDKPVLPTIEEVSVGSTVLIVQKENQSSEILTHGRVKRVLTGKGSHPRGIKVELEDGSIGRVKSVMENANGGQIQRDTNPGNAKISYVPVHSMNSKSKLKADASSFHPKQPPETSKSSLYTDEVRENLVNSSERRRCGCMSTVHPFLGSCFQCGRLICEVEGPSNCFSCGAEFVAPISFESAKTSGFGTDALNAYRHKDKLLVFDKEHAKRTKVFDAQADYYESGAWLTAEEKIEIAEREKIRRDKMRPFKKNMKITIDFAGRKIREAISDDEEEVNMEGAVGNRSACVLNGGISSDCGLHPSDLSSHDTFLVHKDIENLSLSQESGLAGDLYRSLMSTLAPWRDEAEEKTKAIVKENGKRNKKSINFGHIGDKKVYTKPKGRVSDMKSSTDSGMK